MDEKPLPEPDSAELAELLPGKVHQMVYGYLHRRRAQPPTMQDIRKYLAEQLGDAPVQTDRRVRDLRQFFLIPSTHVDGQHTYPLVGWEKKTIGERTPISTRLRAQVLAPQRCAQCGKTPLDDGVKLEVDHKIPLEWGGSNELENLQPLCVDCNAGKRAFYATYNAYSDEIRRAADRDSPHERIGELLKAFGGDWVPSQVVSVVASMKKYQDDWQKRLRELRILGWDYKTKKEHDAETGRVNVYYRLVQSQAWPDGSVAAEVRRLDPSNKKGKAEN